MSNYHRRQCQSRSSILCRVELQVQDKTLSARNQEWVVIAIHWRPILRRCRCLHMHLKKYNGPQLDLLTHSAHIQLPVIISQQHTIYGSTRKLKKSSSLLQASIYSRQWGGKLPWFCLASTSIAATRGIALFNFASQAMAAATIHTCQDHRCYYFCIISLQSENWNWEDW